MASLSEREAREALYLWRLWARPKQLEPPGDWFVWLILAGRGFGKSRTGAEWVRQQVEEKGARRVALVGPTAADVRDVMVEGESGLLAVCPPWFRPVYEPSKRRLTWPNGAIATTYSADEPNRLRGPQHDAAWADELAAWRYAEAWDQLTFGLRLGVSPRVVVTTTPRPRPLIRELRDAPTTHVTTGSTYENAGNLAAPFIAQIVKKYEGTRLGRQELHAEVLDVLQGAVYEDFDPKAHVIDWQPSPSCRLLVGMDFGVTASSVLFAQETGDFPWRLPDGRTLPPRSLVVFDELQPAGLSTERTIPLIQKKLAGRRIDALFCDPAGAARDIASGLPSVQLLREAFGEVVRYETAAAERWIPNGISRVQLALRPARGEPELYFARGLLTNGERRGIVPSLRSYSYPETKPGAVPSDHPVHDEWSHANDALRYLLIGAQNQRRDSAAPARLQVARR